MKLIKTIKSKEFLLFGTFFVLFFVSHTINIFRISEPNLFHGFERQPEGLVVGRIARSAQDGFFSFGGLNGVNRRADAPNTEEQYALDLATQHHLYMMNEGLPEGYKAYKSQSGGQAMLFSLVHKVLPYDNAKKLATYRAINALLIALVFVLFGAWVYRNFGLIPSVITLLLTLFSPWINMFAHNLWWVLWSFYIPFISMLLVLEYRSKYPHRISNFKVLFYLFIAVFLKCFFTGFEFITTSLIAALCPFIYYAVQSKQKILDIIFELTKVMLVMGLAIVVQMSMLIFQIKLLDGAFSDGVHHILSSFTRRSEFSQNDATISQVEIIKEYLQNDAFQLGFLANNTPFYFGILIAIVIVTLCIIFTKYKALCITTVFSFLAPLSWLIVFKQHSAMHMHMNYIIWYIPSLLLGFCCIGIAFSLLFEKIKFGKRLDAEIKN